VARPTAQVWYSVDRSGQLTVTGIDEGSPISPEALAAVKRACAKKPK
jgi:hypothetical protein